MKREEINIVESMKVYKFYVSNLWISCSDAQQENFDQPIITFTQDLELLIME